MLCENERKKVVCRCVCRCVSESDELVCVSESGVLVCFSMVM